VARANPAVVENTGPNSGIDASLCMCRRRIKPADQSQRASPLYGPVSLTSSGRQNPQELREELLWFWIGPSKEAMG
jgi:hypothetical protein